MAIFRRISMLIICVAFIIGAYFFYFTLYGSSLKSDYRIALCAPAMHPAMDEIFEGFKDVMQGGRLSYSFDVYNAQGNKTLLRAQAEEVVQQKYDLVFTIGTTCSHIMRTLTEKKGVKTPVVFTAVEDPVHLGLVASLVSSGNNMTGTTVCDDFERQFDLLLQVKPDTQNILFVYDPADGAQRDALCLSIKKIIKEKGMNCIPVQVFQLHEIPQKVMSFMHAADVVFIYTDHTVVSGVDSLVTLCNRFGKPLFASDLNSGAKGAALAYGVREYDHGAQAAEKALLILEGKKDPSDVEVTPVHNQQLHINAATMHSQGLVLSPEYREKMRLQVGGAQ